MTRWVPAVGVAAAFLQHAEAAPPGAAQLQSPIQRALSFLFWHQVAQPIDVTIGATRVRDYPGNWAQHFHLQGSDLRVRCGIGRPVTDGLVVRLRREPAGPRLSASWSAQGP